MRGRRLYVGRFLLLGVVVSGILLAGITFAFMFKKTATVSNDFVPAKVMCKVVEVFDDTKKSSITVKNDDAADSNIEAYIRIRLISYWVDGSGNVVGKPSEMPAISYDSNSWIKCSNEKEHMYYHKGIVASGDSTAEFLTADMELQTGMLDETPVYQVVDVFAEAIQANPKDAVIDAWGVTVTDSVISAAP